MVKYNTFGKLGTSVCDHRAPMLGLAQWVWYKASKCDLAARIIPEI